MKSLIRFASLTLGASALAGLSLARAQTSQAARNPIVITMPAIPDGSNRSRAPFPAERRFDDVQRPNGQPVDLNVPPNTPATDPEPDPIPAPRVAILQRTPAPAAGSTTLVVMNPGPQPGALPTGRTVVGLASSLDAERLSDSLRSASESNRAALFTNIENRMANVRAGLDSLRLTSTQMSDSGRARFSAAESELQARAKDLRESLQEARSATGPAWESARTRVAADFEAYAAAAGRVDAVSGAAATH